MSKQYPDSLESRCKFESTIYDRWYQGDNRLDKPFFYHNSSTERRFVRALVSRFGLANGSTLLDIGCGNGLYSMHFQQYGIAVTGVDNSEKAIAYCRSNDNSTCSWLQADAFSLGFREEFDYAFSHFFTFFNQFDDPRNGVESASKLMEYLRPHGSLYFVWISDLSAIRLPENRFSIMNFTLQQVAEFFPNYRTAAFAIDSRARLPLLLGRFAFNKYVTRLSCAAIQLLASSWKRVRIVLQVQK